LSFAGRAPRRGYFVWRGGAVMKNRGDKNETVAQMCCVNGEVLVFFFYVKRYF
jgi:hypothetical protein